MNLKYKATTHINKIEKWCLPNLFLYYSIEPSKNHQPFQKFHQLNFLIVFTK
jgi:hypothetical protein